jgi:lauroyl/myristoyl acyltransferase
MKHGSGSSNSGRPAPGGGAGPDLVALARSRPRWARALRWGHAWLDLAAVVGAYLVTFLPQRIDRWMVAATMPFYRTLLRRKVDAVAAKMQRLVGDPPPDRSWDEAALEYWRMRAEAHWLRVRSLHRRVPDVDITLEGLEYLEAALAAGTGAILWRMFFCSSHIPMQALAEVGYPLVHLSHWDHGSRGFNTPGLKLFPRLWLRAEVRHLEERVVIPRDSSLGYLRRLLEHLGSNHVLSIFGNIPGRSGVPIEILGTSRLLAAGAPSLARRTGAPLLTMHAVRLGPDRFRVVIDEPVQPDAGLDRRDYLEAAVAEYARRVESRVRANPASWYRWAIYQDHRGG